MDREGPSLPKGEVYYAMEVHFSNETTRCTAHTRFIDKLLYKYHSLYTF